MKIRIDNELCTGHGRCYSLAPDVFDADDEGHSTVVTPEVQAGFEDAARQAASNCPERAIFVDD